MILSPCWNGRIAVLHARLRSESMVDVKMMTMMISMRANLNLSLTLRLDFNLVASKVCPSMAQMDQ